ncbi:IclR family transcriptional regulator [Terriglobus albidus]|uniref:IclR family transcriptional regulator n=1 Tax=Terriglobus albidus TaxID=1592106 RepID=A0A5B9EAM3_9BACT|nr:IclR family transcriptional regulator [Terriglobus albidus]QEE29203.1 IclR family transcriptional regulator [Terriglobus albidus]
MKKAKAPSATTAKKSVRRRVPKWALQSSDSGTGDDAYYLRSIGRALDVLNCFDGQTPLSLKEISGRTKQPESSLFRVLRTLESREYLVQDRDGTYQLAPRLIFGWLVRAADHVKEVARPELEWLANHFNETASLAFLFDDRIHVLDCLETFHEIRMTNKKGRVLPPHCSAMGKVITAFQERPAADQMLEVYGLNPRTEHTIIDRKRLYAEFEGIRKTGIGCDREESIRGGICFAAAIQPKDKPVVAAISLSTPSIRMDKAREAEIQSALLEAAKKIAAKL